jgi:diaminobutyrate-2-oxoglutarate transaminase
MAASRAIPGILPGPRVTGELPGPRSAELLARQDRHESNARTYLRHLPIAIDTAEGSFVRDLDGNVFIDFLTGAGVLSLGHNHPELVAVATEQLGRFTHGLDLASPAKDAFIEAQLSMLPAPMRDRMKLHFCGPTGANAVEAALKVCKTATGRETIVSFSGAFHGASHGAMAVTALVEQKQPVPGGMPGVHFFPTRIAPAARWGSRRSRAQPTACPTWRTFCAIRTGAFPFRRRSSWSWSKGKAAPSPPRVSSCGECGS